MKIRNEQDFFKTFQNVLLRIGYIIYNTGIPVKRIEYSKQQPITKHNVHVPYGRCCSASTVIVNNKTKLSLLDLFILITTAVQDFKRIVRSPKHKQLLSQLTESCWKIIIKTYLKLTQPCLVIISLLCLQIISTTIVQQVNGHSIIISIENATTYNKLERSWQNKQNNNVAGHSPYSNISVGPIKNLAVIKSYNDDNYFYEIENSGGTKTSWRNKTAHLNTRNFSSKNYSLIVLSRPAKLNNSMYSSFKAVSSISVSSDDFFNYVLNNIPNAANSVISFRRKRNIQLHELYDNQFKQIKDTRERNKKKKKTHSKSINKERLTKIVMGGLKLKKIPDMSKANVSQIEYTSKYIEYLQRTQKIEEEMIIGHHNLPVPSPTMLQIFSIVPSAVNDVTDERWRRKRTTLTKDLRQNQLKRKTQKKLVARDKTNIILHFPLSIKDAQLHSDNIDEANLRLMLLLSPSLAAKRPVTTITAKKHRYNNKNTASEIKCVSDDTVVLDPDTLINEAPKYEKKNRTYTLNLKVFQLFSSQKRQLLDTRKLEFGNLAYDETHSQWLEFDVTRAVRGWLNKSHENLGIEIQCDKCMRIGARILTEISPYTSISEEEDKLHIMPVINIIGHHGRTYREGGIHRYNASNNNMQSTGSRHHPDYAMLEPNNCQNKHPRCCRHKLNVVFKNIKGFEFIIQPKMFDAGFCQGRCPPRHNPAHHHALLQSLMWQQNSSRVPRPCCAPSKLAELEVLHLDEEHSDKLKISTWSDMQVVECSCS